MTAFADALAWTASFEVWRRSARHRDGRAMRDLWCEAVDGDAAALLAVRVRQADRWLSIDVRERRRRATINTKRAAQGERS